MLSILEIYILFYIIIINDCVMTLFNYKTIFCLIK